MIFDVVHRQEHKPLMSMLPLLQCMHLLSKDVGPFVTYYRTYDDLINHIQRDLINHIQRERWGDVCRAPKAVELNTLNLN